VICCAERAQVAGSKSPALQGRDFLNENAVDELIFRSQYHASGTCPKHCGTGLTQDWYRTAYIRSL
jgi:hypothetical protein